MTDQLQIGLIGLELVHVALLLGLKCDNDDPERPAADKAS